jgi:hypothetical protein
MQGQALFCSWLKQHAGLVGFVSFHGPNTGIFRTRGRDAYCDAAEQLLALGLQEAAAAAAAPAAAAMRIPLPQEPRAAAGSANVSNALGSVCCFR